MTRSAAYLSLWASMTLVGTYVALSKPLTAALPVFILAGLRFGIAAIVMLPWLKRGPDEAPLSPSSRMWLFWQSFFGNFLFSACMLYGVALSSASAAGIIMSLIPAAVALLSWLMLGERPGGRVITALLLAVAAIAFINLAKLDTAGTASAAQVRTALLGNALLLGAVFCEALYVVIGKRLADQVSPKRVSALINLVGLALTLPFAIGTYLLMTPRFDFGGVSTQSWLLLVFYSLAASQWAVWLWMTGLKKVPASQAGVFTVALPIASCLVGALFLGERLAWPHGLAFACAAAGVWLIATATPDSKTH
jgi:drug/metabolite transporter (DMT)-like permease